MRTLCLVVIGNRSLGRFYFPVVPSVGDTIGGILNDEALDLYKVERRIMLGTQRGDETFQVTLHCTPDNR